MASPIQKVVIFLMGNHTTDNVASEVAGVDGNSALPLAPDVVVPDPRHDHAHWLTRDSPAPGSARRQRFDRQQLPNLYKLMAQFTVCDRYFADYAGNSFPNHAFAVGADAEWTDRNPGVNYTVKLQAPGVPARLLAAGKTWANYGMVRFQQSNRITLRLRPVRALSTMVRWARGARVGAREEQAMPSITMPQLGESVTEGTIGRWLKKTGDRVKRDEAIVEVITDKVNAEIPAPAAGVLERISALEGTVVAVGQEIAFLAADVDARMPPAAPLEAARTSSPTPSESRSSSADDSGAEDNSPRMSPLVRKLVREHALDLRLIRGSGLGGRVTREDIEAYLRDRPETGVEVRTVAAPTTSPPLPGDMGPAPTVSVGAPGRAPVRAGERSRDATGDERLTPSPIRRTIAHRMVQSVHEIPHAWLMIETDVSKLVRFRENVKERFRRAEGVDLTYLPFLMKAAAETLREFPLVNATWKDDQIILKREVNLGVAVALDDGLVVPVVHNADQLSLTGLARVLADIVGRARASKLSVADVEGGTFTVNNTGAFGSIASQPIINYPQAGIMTMEAIVKRPVVIDDAIAIRSMLNLCLSVDHRILDGATAGRFLQSVRRRLESWGPESSV